MIVPRECRFYSQQKENASTKTGGRLPHYALWRTQTQTNLDAAHSHGIYMTAVVTITEIWLHFDRSAVFSDQIIWL